jgi:hypothetical protein
MDDDDASFREFFKWVSFNLTAIILRNRLRKSL